MTSIETIRKELELRMQALLERIAAIDADVSHHDQPLSNDWSEQAVERENEEVLEALGNASQKEVAQIRKALTRIDNGRYQECESCGDTIPLERLKLVPHAIYCTQCAQQQETARKTQPR